MSTPRHIAVIDVGKTNVKLALVDGATLAEIAVVTRPNTVLPGPPWPHFDLEGHWRFFLDALGVFHRNHGVDAISITTHGASAVLLDRAGDLAAPMLDYEHDGPEAVAAEYDAIRSPFEETGSPRLSVGLNVGAQLFWQFGTMPGLRERVAHILGYPQYWGYRLTGERAIDLTSIGCHTDLWNPWRGQVSGLADRLGVRGKILAPRRPDEILGTITAAVAGETGLAPDTPVAVGIHDSNASLYPCLRTRDGAFAVVSTGTWVVAMAVGGARVALDPARDTLVNVNALGQPTQSAKFMGGREYEIIRAGMEPGTTPADRAAVLAAGAMLLPSVEAGSGPFQGCAMRWAGEPREAGQRMVALSWYLAMMTDICLDLIGARGPTLVEGPFARNPDYCAMLAALRPAGVEAGLSVTGASAGAALLLATRAVAPDTRPVAEENAASLRDHAALWRERVAAHTGR